MRLKCHNRVKDGKDHRYWSIVESVRCSRERVVQRHVLYLGELNDSQREGWTRCLDAIDGNGRTQQLALFPADREIHAHAQGIGIQVRLDAMRLERPRQWGACWLFTELWSQLKLDDWKPLLPDKLGAAKKEAGRDWSLVDITLPPRPVRKAALRERVDFTFTLDKQRLRIARRREGRYLLRSNLTDTDPGKLWQMYLQLTQVEQAFKDLKGDLGVRPVYHQKDGRIEAHIMVCFLAYCVHVTLRAKLQRHAPGLTPRQVLDHLGKMQMIDVRLPATDGRELLLRRRTEPNAEQQLLLTQLQLELPQQPPPKITGM